MRDGRTFVKEEGLAPIVVLTLVDVALLLFSALVVLPLFAMASTVATANPKRLLREIEREKERGEVDEHHKGVGG